MSTPERPLADSVTDDFVTAIDSEVVAMIGRGFHVRHYAWAGDDDQDEWPFVVVRDGREFEVDIDVHVTELTPELKAKREADAKRLLAALEARAERQAAEEAQR